MTRLKKAFVEGLASFLPFALTLWAVYFVFASVYHLFDFSRHLLPVDLRRHSAVAQVITAVLSVAFIAGVGVLAQTIAGRALFRLLSGWVEAIPLLKSVHSGVRQLLELLFRPSSLAGQRPVRVPFPHPRVMAIGLVTGEVPKTLRPRRGRRYFKVFVPTVPNPTSGFLVLYREDDVFPIELNREQLVRVVLSGGVLDDEETGGTT